MSERVQEARDAIQNRIAHWITLDTQSVLTASRLTEDDALDALISAVREDALRRVQEGVKGMRIARYNESVVREGGKPTDTVYFAIEPEGDWVRYEDYAAVLALLDREATA